MVLSLGSGWVAGTVAGSLSVGRVVGMAAGSPGQGS